MRYEKLYKNQIGFFYAALVELSMLHLSKEINVLSFFSTRDICEIRNVAKERFNL
jgi:hypothetical protein